MAAEDYLPDGWEAAIAADGTFLGGSRYRNEKTMSEYKHKLNRGRLFVNERKTRESQPDFTGTIDVNGTIYWISAWDNRTFTGKRTFGLAVTQQEERKVCPAPKPKKARKGKARKR